METSDIGMQYGHMERRDSNLESNGSTPFQSHQSLGQALGGHLNGPPYSRATDSYRNLSTSPPGLNQTGGPPQSHAGASSSHSPLTFNVAPTQSSPAMKRKQVDGVGNSQVLKRRREGEDPDAYDIDGGGQGAKHWTDDEKTKLFQWLMGPGQDDHWNSLRATKNSCLRECAVEVFGSKKTYQALKGCYERNFNLFKQIYAFETFAPPIQNINQMSEGDRQREYDRRLQQAKKAQRDVGNIGARTIDHWHRMGWYDLFYRRWNGDPATSKPVQSRNSGAGMNSGGAEDPEVDDDPIEFDPGPVSNDIPGLSHDRPLGQTPMTFINPQSLRDVPQPPPAPLPMNGPPASSSSASPESPLVNIPITQNMLATYLQFLQVQTQTGKLKIEYLRRKEEREEKESSQRRELERLRLERETAEFEHTKHSASVKQKTDKAIEVLASPVVDASVKQAAGDFLKKLFATD